MRVINQQLAYFHLNHRIVLFANRILFLPLSEHLLKLIFLNCLQAKRHELLISYLFTLVKVLNATMCSTFLYLLWVAYRLNTLFSSSICSSLMPLGTKPIEHADS